MRLLVLGGTQFVGRHFVEAALAQGRELTLFNRGRTAATLFPQLECRQGDRRSDLSALARGEWDAVFDSCGYLPREVAASAKLLKGRVGRYLFISSVSAYAGSAVPNDESSPLATLASLPDPQTEVVDGASYGPLKAACEQVLVDTLGEAALIFRPGLVVGPHDPTQRFSYWPVRVARAMTAPRPETVLLAGSPGAALQWIDARDLAEFGLRSLAAGLNGRFNVVAGPGQWRMDELLAACVQAVGPGPEPRWHWAAPDRLQALDVKPWIDLPLWLPDDAEHAAFMACSNQAALAAGLRIRSIDQTVADTLAWWRGLPAEQQGFSRAGLSPEREAEVLRVLAA